MGKDRPRCAMCGARLTRAQRADEGTPDVWACPKGHGVAVTGAEGGDVVALWARAEAAAPGIRRCPRCEGEMAVVQLDADRPVKADGCPLCEVLWFDGLEITGLTPGQPDPEELVGAAFAQPTIAALLSSDEMQPAL